MKSNRLTPVNRAVFAWSVLFIALMGACFQLRAVDGSWSVDANGAWTTTGNWAGSTIADGAGSVAYFTNNLTADRTVSLGATARTIGYLVISDGDNSTAAGWVFARTSTILTLSAGTTPSITVTNLAAGKQANIRYPLAGTQGFSKEGDGTLQLGGSSTYSDTYSGLTIVNAGTLTCSSSSSGDTLIPGDLAINSGGTYSVLSTENIADTANVTNAGTFTMAGKTETISTMVLIGGTILQNSTALLVVNNTFDARSGSVLEASGATGKLDVGNFVKSTPGVVTLTTRGSSATSGGLTNTTVNDGTLIFDYTQNNSKLLDSGSLTVNSGTLIFTNGSHSEAVGSVTLAGGAMTNASGTSSLTVSSGNYDVRSGSGYIKLGGAAGLIKSTGGTVVLGADNPYSGDTRIGAGTLTLDNITALHGTTLDMNSGDTGSLSFGTLTAATLGGLKGSRDLDLDNGASAAVACSIGNNIQSTTYSGALTGGGSLIKIGSGTLTLTGANTYTGTTTVSNGTLSVSGSIGTNSVTVAGGTLGGNGVISGPVTVLAGAKLAPGASVGLLTISNSLVLQTNSTCFIEVDKTGGTNDTMAGLTSVSYAGTLSVTNISLTAFAANDSFQIFNAASYSGAFNAISPATPGLNLAWDTSSLAVNGTLKVINAAPSSPSIGTFTISAGNAILAGTGGPINGNYLVLTSSDATISVANWGVLTNGAFDGSGNFASTNAVIPSILQLFYRIQVQ